MSTKYPMHSCFLLLLGFILLLESCKGPETESAKSKPNIVLIITDDQGWGDLSLHGNSNLRTPNIDSIATEGARFENFYVQPVCSPTRAEIYTGLYFPRTKVYATSAGGERMSLAETTIGEVFKEAGYRTGIFGKWHNGTQPPYHPNSRGFDEFYGFCSGHWGDYFDPLLEHNGEMVNGKGYIVDHLFDKAMQFLGEEGEQPKLLVLPVNTPHSPMQVPDSYWKSQLDRELKMAYQGVEEEDELFTKAALAMVENIDYNVGRLRKYLSSAGLKENTILVFMSDNGPNGWRWNGGLKGKKGSTDEGGVKSPFFIEWADRITTDARIGALAGSVDVFPTLAGLADIKVETHSTLDGEDFSGVLLSEKDTVNERALYQHWNGQTSVRVKGFRLSHQNDLYDLKNDPGQKNPVNESLPDLRASLIQLKTEWEVETGVLEPRVMEAFTVKGLTHLPARDGIATGAIQRSNRYPNDSYYRAWNSITDSIYWPIDILEEGEYEVTIFGTQPSGSLGSEMELSTSNSVLSYQIKEEYDSPEFGSEEDRIPRIESYVKTFKTEHWGSLFLKEGKDTLVLKANSLPGEQAIELRLLILRPQN